MTLKANSIMNASFAHVLVLLAVGANGVFSPASAQPAAGQAPAPAAAAFGGRGIPNPSRQQAIAVVQMDDDLATLTQSVSAARSSLSATVFAEPRNDQAIQSSVDKVKAAELGLATARQAAFAKVQRSPGKLDPGQVTAFAAMGGTAAGVGGGGGRGRGTASDFTPQLTASLQKMTSDIQPLAQAVMAARTALGSASVSSTNPAVLQAPADKLAKAELALAKARATAFAALQASPDKLSTTQTAAFVAMGGAMNAGRGPGGGGGGSLNGPTPLVPLNFNDHEGYVSLFDGKTLKDWDGNPKFWRVEDGAIIGESSPQNPSGNQYIAYRATEAHDFTLKFEMKVEGTGGSGMQYRSQVGMPWTSSIPLEVTANVGPVNLNWMMTGPQADFFPSTDPASRWTGQFYSENDPMRIMASRGNVVEGYGLGTKRLMGSIGDATALFTAVKPTGWNEYTVVARGNTFIQIINGQLMSVMVDDDPNSLNNKSGYIGIELESNAKVSVRNVWLKKIN